MNRSYFPTVTLDGARADLQIHTVDGDQALTIDMWTLRKLHEAIGAALEVRDAND